MLARVVASLSCVALLTGCSSPRDPSSDRQRDERIHYTAIGASDAVGIGSSAPCRKRSACEKGKGYVPVLARMLRSDREVELTNLGISGAVLSPTIEAIAGEHGVYVPGNFLDDEAPYVPAESTLVTVFGGGNDANALVAAIDRGAGRDDLNVFVDAQIRAFGDDYERLLREVRQRAPAARVVLVNLPNFALLPFTADEPVRDRSLRQRITTGFSQAANALGGQGVTVVDVMCDDRAYDPANFAFDGFHPNDRGYELFAMKLLSAIRERPEPPPARCAQMRAPEESRARY